MAMIFIIIGSILLVFGILGILAVAFEPIKHSFIILFKRESLDHYQGDNELLTKEREKSVRIAYRAFIVLIICGFIFLGIGLFIKFVPHGEDSLFSKPVDGLTVGDGDINSENEDVQDENNINEYASSIIDTNNTDNSVYIVVRGSDITFSNIEFTGIEDFTDYFKDFNSVGIDVYLVDNFAISKTYYDVKNALDTLGIRYEEMTE